MANVTEQRLETKIEDLKSSVAMADELAGHHERARKAVERKLETAREAMRVSHILLDSKGRNADRIEKLLREALAEIGQPQDDIAPETGPTDKERLDWLEKSLYSLFRITTSCCHVSSGFDGAFPDAETMRGAIDVAMRAKKGHAPQDDKPSKSLKESVEELRAITRAHPEVQARNRRVSDK